MTEKTYGIVTDFKRFAVHDGDGIRTTLFLKGCPLRCLWCHNPESMGIAPQTAFYSAKCIHCGQCVRVCPNHAQRMLDGVHILDHTRCTGCGRCAAVCGTAALQSFGREMTLEQVMEHLLLDRLFYETSGGGITLSGGEPTMQPGFALAILKTCKQEGLNTALDTCGLADGFVYEALLPYVDTFLFDVKHIDPEAHERLTGHRNDKIVHNLRLLSDSGAEIEVRIPLIPGCNDDEATLRSIGGLLAELHIRRVRVLPYHDFARSRYEALGMPYRMPPVARPGQDAVERAVRLIGSP